MRLKPRPETPTRYAKDKKKRGNLLKKLQTVSDRKRKRELQESHKVLKHKRAVLRLNVRGDRRGMHLAANPPSSEQMQAVRSKRKLWNKHMPVLACNNCAFTSQCPQYRASYECAFLPFLHGHVIETPEDLLHYAKELLQQNLRRAQMTLLQENLTGSPPTAEASEGIQMLFGQLMQLHERMTESVGELEITEDRTIIGELFGGLKGLVNSTQNQIDNPIEIPVCSEQLAEGEEEEAIDEQLLQDMAKFSPKSLGFGADTPTIKVETLP